MAKIICILCVFIDHQDQNELRETAKSCKQLDKHTNGDGCAINIIFFNR